MGMARSKNMGSDEPMLRGTLFTLRRKCGKPTCRCADGEAHESPALAFPDRGRTGTLTLRDDDVDDVRRALAAYAAAKSELDDLADGALVELKARLAARRPRRQR